MEKVKLLSISKHITDGEHGSVRDTSSDYFFLSNKNIVDGQVIITNGDRTISEIDFNRIMNRIHLQKNSILISTVGEIGKLAFISDRNEQINYVFQRSVGVINIDETKANPYYVYLYLKCPSVQDYLHFQSKGSVQKCLFIGDMENLEIFLPSLTLQNKIVDCIRPLEQKIRNNDIIISELESLAKTIYDYWFLQFDFPNEEGKPYKSSGGAMVWNEELKMEIPKGWSVTKLGNLADIVTGKEDANHAVPNGKYPFFTCSNSISKCNDFKFDGKAILIAGNGDFNIKYYDGKFNAYQRTYVVTPKDDMMTGLLYFCVLKNTIRFTNASVGSIEKFITKGDVENIPIIIPNNKIGFEVFNNCLNLIQNYKKENDELIELRDFLLPLLMNGQVGFKDK